MKRLFKFYIIAIMIMPAILLLTACGDGSSQGKEISGITYVSASYDYDNTAKTLLITGTLPEGVSVEYTNNTGTSAGIYNATAVLSGEGYKTKILTATLTINKINYDMTGVSWDYSEAFKYNGNLQTVTIKGDLPAGVSVANYSNNSKTEVGEYSASVTFNYDRTNYNAPTLANCHWRIEKAEFNSVTFNSKIVEYDTLQHSIVVVGNLPANSVVSYTYNNENVTSVTEVGSYTVKATLTNANYVTKVLTATLIIKSTEEQLFSVNVDGTVYFQNNLDDNKLYSYNGMTLRKVNNDIPNYMIANEGNVYYFSSSLFSKVIKQLTGSSASVLSEISGEYLATDGTYLYYAVNNLILNIDENGIYKYKLDGSEEAPIRLTTDKAAYLTYYDGNIYYSNLSNNKYLSKISTTSVNGTSTTLREEKIEYLVEDSGVLYFNSTKEKLGVDVASAIYKYIISSNTCIKLTTDSGKYLTKIGSYIYYINNDLLTSTLFGDGIYKTSVLKTEDSSLPGIKILETKDNGYSSLTSNGENLYYYKLNDKHFYKYNISTETENDLMKDFVVVDDTILSGYAKLAEYNGEFYYTNPLDNSCLYKYNPTTQQKIKVLSNSVSNVYFHNGYMYYSTFVVTNYALYKMDLQTNESIKISSDRCENLIFDNDIIYYQKVGATSITLNKMDLDGGNIIELYSEKGLWIKCLQKYGDDIYFIINPAIGYKYIYKYSISSETATSLNIKAEDFVIDNNIIYYYSHTDKQLCKFDLSGKDIVSLQNNVEINDMIISNDKIYYSSNSSANKGVYIYNILSNLNTKISEKFADGLLAVANDIYFMQTVISYTVNYPSNNVNSDGHLYMYNGVTITKKA